MSELRRTGEGIWRPSVGLRITWLLIGAAMLGGTVWLGSEGELSSKDKVMFGAADLAALTLLPVVLFRWRMVLDRDAVSFVFLRVRRIPVRDIVGAKNVPGEGLTFVLDDGSEESFHALGNSAWARRRPTPTRTDLAARAVLCAAAEARGESPPIAYRLPPMKDLKKAMLKGGIWAAIVGFFISS